MMPEPEELGYSGSCPTQAEARSARSLDQQRSCPAGIESEGSGEGPASWSYCTRNFLELGQPLLGAHASA